MQLEVPWDLHSHVKNISPDDYSLKCEKKEEEKKKMNPGGANL
jgi:hypothetical protein